MLRNKEIPQGIRATRLGYPVRREGGPYLFNAERNDLLKNYSNQQLSKVSENLDRNAKTWKVVERGAQALTLLGILAPLGVLTAAGFEYTYGFPYDPIVTGAFNGIHDMLPMLSHVGIHDTASAFYGLSAAAPAVTLTTGVIAEQMSQSRSTQVRNIEKEQTRRFIQSLQK